MISKQDGDKIIAHYMKYKDNKEEIRKIRFEIKFDIESKNNYVNYDIWYTPDIEKVYSFLSDFEKYQNALGPSVKVTPHFVTYPHFMYDPNSQTPKDDCLGSGLYCIRPGKLGIVDGTEIVIETIKQKCIYQYAQKNNKEELYWKYMAKFYENCIQKEDFNEQCSYYAISSAGIPPEEINGCFYNSFQGTENEKKDERARKIIKNNILDSEYELRKQYTISRVPSLIINGRPYLGSWRAEYVFEALCAALIKKPDACYAEGKFQREVKGFSLVATCLIILVVIFINVVLFVSCKEYIKSYLNKRIKSSDIDSKIDTVVNSYIALRESKDSNK